MTFAEPVESLNAHSTALRECEPRAPKDIKATLIAAADALDDQQKQIEDLTDSQRLVKAWLGAWAHKLEESTRVRIGQMDSASMAHEKTITAQRAVLEIVQAMRDVL